MTRSPYQADLFDAPLYPVRINTPQIDQERFERDLSRAVGRALDQCDQDRFEIAKRMAKALGQDDFSKSMLDAYASESKETHTISIVRFIALIKASGQDWLMDFLASRVGAVALVGDEAALAEQARIDNEIRRLQSVKRDLKSAKVKPKRRTRS